MLTFKLVSLLLAPLFNVWPWNKIHALENRVKELELLATHDELTGALNRRGCSEVVAHHFSILSRDSKASSNLAVLNLDLDRFKGINDTYGHEVGDQVIKFFAGTLRSALRNEHDVVVRVGGDEFLIILPQCTREGAEVVKQKVKSLLATRALNSPLALSTSVGIAMARSEYGTLRHSYEVLALADKAMYEDKEQNRVARDSRIHE